MAEPQVSLCTKPGATCPASDCPDSRRIEAGLSRPALLISRRLRHVVDDPHFDRSFGGIEFQPELLLNRGEEIRRIGIDRWRSCTGRQLSGLNLGCELEFELPITGQAGAIDNGTTNTAADASREQLQRVVSKTDSTGSLLDPADRRRRTARSRATSSRQFFW